MNITENRGFRMRKKQVHSVQGYILLLLLLVIASEIPLVCDTIEIKYLQQVGRFGENQIWDSSPMPFGFQIVSYLKSFSLFYVYYVSFLVEHTRSLVSKLKIRLANGGVK